MIKITAFAELALDLLVLSKGKVTFFDNVSMLVCTDSEVQFDFYLIGNTKKGKK
jgi:hypothetical protein